MTYNPYSFAVVEDVELTAIFEVAGTQGIGDIAVHNDYKVYAKIVASSLMALRDNRLQFIVSTED